jgi:formyltetrahydrofolate-dependent phosphoribosylglycinamide formyltransferase
MSGLPMQPRSSRTKPVIAVFCSGNGTNFQALAQAERRGRLRAELVVMVADSPQAGAIVRARRLGIEALVISPKHYSNREEYDHALLQACHKRGVEWVVLAGYMRILTAPFVRAYAGRIVNIHPSLLPAFPGAHAVRDALARGVKFTGVTVHLVTEAVDSGPILAQAVVPVKPGDNQVRLHNRIHKVEHQLYPTVLQKLFSGRFKINTAA